jgi:hypothetical protein
MRTTATRGRFLLLLAAVLVVTACGSPAPPGETGSPGPSGSESSGSAPSGPTPSTPAGEAARPPAVPQPVWDAVLADLAARRGGQVGPVTVVSAEAVTWNDGSLGCPEPGMVYTQALVDGYHVVLEVGGERYDYRVGSGTAVKLCTSAAGTS